VAERLVLLSLFLAAPALAGEPGVERTVLRMGAIAPEGTAWARELHAMSRALAAATGDQVAMKWYLGGIAGDEMSALERARRGQLDGLGGALYCTKLAPSLVVARVLGLVQSHEETLYVLGRLGSKLADEFRQNGFELLALGTFGQEILVSRTPVRGLQDLRRTRAWFWDLDEVWKAEWKALGVPAAALPIEEARRAYEDKRTDGYLGVPSAQLAFQWSSGGGYFTELKASFIPGCLVMREERFQALQPAARQALLDAVAKFQHRFNELARTQDAELLGGLFARQGLHKIDLTPAAREELAAAFVKARATLPGALVPPALIERVEGWLKEYRGSTAGK
jgi:TRAP-type C4-dicarboxylate transport system substrate-binding protein